MRIEPYVVAVPDAVLDDLHDRIRRTRWPDPAPGEAWGQGVDLGYLRGLLSYWAARFDWRERERELNRHTHRIAEVDGVRIHFVHRRGTGRVPLVLTHGWPSTFVEMLPLVDRLDDRFDLVVPSLPGYAFSQRPPYTGVDRAYVAGLWHRLMQGLGYQRYGAYGSDFGAGVATLMALSQPDRMIGIHLSLRFGRIKFGLSVDMRPPVVGLSNRIGRNAHSEQGVLIGSGRATAARLT